MSSRPAGGPLPLAAAEPRRETARRSQLRSPPAPSRPEVRGGDRRGMGWDAMGRGTAAEDRRLGPLGVLEPRLAPPRSRPCLPRLSGGRTVGSARRVVPGASAARPGPPIPYPTHSAAAQRQGRDPSLAPSAARQVLRTWGMGLGDREKTGPRRGGRRSFQP